MPWNCAEPILVAQALLPAGVRTLADAPGFLPSQTFPAADRPLLISTPFGRSIGRHMARRDESWRCRHERESTLRAVSSASNHCAVVFSRTRFSLSRRVPLAQAFSGQAKLTWPCGPPKIMKMAGKALTRNQQLTCHFRDKACPTEQSASTPAEAAAESQAVRRLLCWRATDSYSSSLAEPRAIE